MAAGDVAMRGSANRIYAVQSRRAARRPHTPSPPLRPAGRGCALRARWAEGRYRTRWTDGPEPDALNEKVGQGVATWHGIGDGAVRRQRSIQCMTASGCGVDYAMRWQLSHQLSRDYRLES